MHLSKQLDNGAPNYMRAEFDANNTELGDAYTWLGATEAAIGKTVEAEASYKAAARAVEDRGVVEFCDKLLHQAIFFRNRKMREKYDATLKRWETALRAAGGGDCPEGDVALLQATVSLLQEKCQGLTLGPSTTDRTSQPSSARKSSRKLFSGWRHTRSDQKAASL